MFIVDEILGDVMSVKVDYAEKDTFKGMFSAKWNKLSKTWTIANTEENHIKIKEYNDILKAERIARLERQEAAEKAYKENIELMKAEAKDKAIRASNERDAKEEVIAFRKLVNTEEIGMLSREMSRLLRFRRSAQKKEFESIQSKLSKMHKLCRQNGLFSRGLSELCCMNYNRPDKCDFRHGDNDSLLDITVIECEE